MDALPRHNIPSTDANEEVKTLVRGLKTYVYSLLLDHHAMEEVVQETFLFIWERKSHLRGNELRAYAYRTAWFKVLSWRRNCGRGKAVQFSDETLQRIATVAEQQPEEDQAKLAALKECLGKLKPEDRELVEIQYLSNAPTITDHAIAHNVPPNSFYKALSRIRLILRHCIESSQKQSS